MDGNEPSKYIEKIILEILDRPWFWFHQWCTRRTEKFNIAKFNPREAAYAFLRKYDGEIFVKAQKINIRCNNQELHLCVRDLVYGKINKVSNTTVEFIYRKAMFSEIRWPVVTVNRTSRVRWATDNAELMSTPSRQNEIPEIHTDDDYSSITVDGPTRSNTQVVPCMSCNNLDDDQLLSMNSASENTINSFCRECRVRRSVSGLQKLINGDGKSLTLGHGTDNENHFRSSVYIHINQDNNQ